MKAVKRAAKEAVFTEKPVEWYFGKVTSLSPLQISIEQKITLGKAQLILSRNVTDFTVSVSIPSDFGWATQNESGGSGEGAFDSHNHEIAVSKKNVTIHNGLAVGDEVILLRQQGGQKYLVWDKVGVL